jgi:hypothetical protein
MKIESAMSTLITPQRASAMHFYRSRIMSQATSLNPARATLAALCFCTIAPAMAAVDSGSTGADGALNPSINTEIQLPASGILNYTSINIPEGVTVKFKKNALNTPVYLLASGNVTIAGVINVSATDAKPSGTAGDGNTADDGIPGTGGPGGFDGGRGGRADQAGTPAIIRGGAGLGPGGGLGGNEQPDNTCATTGRYFPRFGMGGAYATRGSNYYWQYCDISLRVFAQPYGSSSLQPLIGGSGGGGGRGGSNYAGPGGGGGGGAILIASSGTINLLGTGVIAASGGIAGSFTGAGAGHNGAGGSGGAIRLLATTVTGSGKLYANGGCDFGGGTTPTNCGVAEGGLGGSDGRITVEAENITYSGAASPTYVASRPQVVFVSNIPTLRIASVGGSTVPAVPTGVADVSFPATQTTPVSVAFETSNVPTGNTVTLRVVPAYGAFTEAISPAITGSTTSGTTSVSITLPQGPSTLQATTSYTITIAMGDNLSRFAQNERVQKVELVASLGQASQTVRLITVSGKQYEVPASILQIAGVNG